MTTTDDLIAEGWKARRMGDVVAARRALERAVEGARDAGDRPRLIRALKSLAHVERDRDDEEAALDLYEEATALAREEGDGIVLAHTVRHLGDVYRAAVRTDEAERCYVEALDLYERHPEAPRLDLANAIRPLAILRETQGRAEESRELWRRARRIYAEIDITGGVEESDEHLSNVGGEAPTPGRDSASTST